MTSALRKRAWPIVLVNLIVAMGTLTAHWPTLGAQAITFDDDEYLTENPLVQHPSWASARRFITEIAEPSTVRGYYQPLSMISLMLDHALGGRADRLGPFHRTSLLLHATNAVLVSLLLYLLFGRVIPAAMVALLFGLHPMTIESVAWIAERKTLLAAFFALISLLNYVQYARTKRFSFYVASMMAFLCSLLSKPSATPLPLLLLLLDYWPLGRLTLSNRTATLTNRAATVRERNIVPLHSTSLVRTIVLEKLPFLLAAALSAVVTMISQGNTYGLTLPHERGLLTISLVVCHNLIFYFQKMLWPYTLSWYCAYPSPFSVTHPAILTGLIGTIALITALLISLRWTRAWAIGVSAFGIALLPTMGIVSFWGLIAADRFVYFPAIGLSIPLAWALGRLYTGKKLATATWTVLAAWTVSLGLSTHFQLSHWRDSESLSRRMVELVPDAAVPRVGLGNAFQARGQIGESIVEYQHALRLEPDNSNALTALGAAFARAGRIDDAVAQYTRALQVKPDDVRAMNNLGVALMEQKRFEDAVIQYRKAVAKKPDYAAAYQNLATALVSLGRNQEALDQAHIALRLSPHNPRTYQHLGGIYAATGRIDEAIGAVRKAIELSPTYPEAHDRLATLLIARGELAQAAYHWHEATRLRPDHAPYHLKLGNALASQDRLTDAETQYREVLQLDAKNKNKNESTLARANLAQILTDQKRFDESIALYREALALQPNDADLQYCHALALHKADRSLEAITAYQESLRIQPDNLPALNNLGAALADLGRFDEAVDTYRRAIALDPKNVTIRINLAGLLSRQGQTDAALTLFREALLLDPTQTQLQPRIEELTKHH
ncbi:MAG: tetratricopeptide repeat protein [Planctomycetota bacterium]